MVLNNNNFLGVVPTLNKMGYMFEDLTKYDEKFIHDSYGSTGPVLDIAAAYGHTILKVLQEDVKVIVNDLDPRHLDILKTRIPENKKHLIEYFSLRFPNQTVFQANYFHGILVSNILHFLSGEEISLGIQKLLEWLKPGGKVYVVAASPYVRIWQEFIPIFEKKRQLKIQWPGYIDDFSIFKSNTRLNQFSKFIHFFHPDDLANAFQEKGFYIEEKGFCSRPHWPYDMQLDGRESVGIVASRGS